jgi:hypothetical protein
MNVVAVCHTRPKGGSVEITLFPDAGVPLARSFYLFRYATYKNFNTISQQIPYWVLRSMQHLDDMRT